MTLGITDKLTAWFLSTVVTRITKAPAVSLTSEQLAEPQVIHVATRHGPVRCLVTRPAYDDLSATALPVHVNFHGGAFLVGEPRQDDHLVRLIAGEARAVVVNVDYSRAPRVHYPHAEEECFDVLRWVASSGTQMGWDASRISVSGSSAGGHLALAVLELARRAEGPAVRAAILIVPLVDVTVPPEQVRSDIAKPFVSPRLIRLSYNSYFPEARRRAEPLASPALWDDEFVSLPPLLIMAGQHDSLRGQQEHFTVLAREHGVSVTYKCFQDADHDFYLNARTPPAVWTEMKNLILDHLRSDLNDEAGQ